MARQLVEVARSVGIMTIAEYVESQEEHAACFELGQGFYYGPPRSVRNLQGQRELPAGWLEVSIVPTGLPLMVTA
jgi:EAL domain-containing protein (putative c-di-GMP-specific phosphodiesterase class I)